MTATETIERYLAIWNEPDAAARAAAIADLYTPDATYTDPLASVRGHDGIAEVVAGAREMFPTLRFTLGDPVDAHHDIARFTWHLGPADAAEPVVVGFDVAVLTEDGRIRAVHGFLDKVPPSF